MKFFTFVKNIGRTTKNSKQRATTVRIVEKEDRFSEADSNETLNRKARAVIITGLENTGKSKKLQSLFENAEGIWRNIQIPVNYDEYMRWDKETRIEKLGNRELKIESTKEINESYEFPTPIYLRTRATVSEWRSQQCVLDWWETKHPDDKITKLKPHERDQVLIDYLKDTKAILFLDDLHVASKTASKSLLLKDLIETASIVVASCIEETQIVSNLRGPLMNRKPQIIRLTSHDSTVDLTYPLTQMLAFVFLIMTGNFDIALILALLKGSQSSQKSRAAKD